jgi:hypothetical protein
METIKTHIRKIWEEVSLTAWKEILTEAGSSKWDIRGKSLRGCCPFPGHSDNSPSCYINTEKKFVKCFGCGAFESNPVKFVSIITASSWSTALKILKDKGVKSLPVKVVQELQEAQLRAELKDEIAKACNDCLVSAILNPNDANNAYAQPLIKYLQTRGVPINKDCIKWLPIGVLPPWVLLRANISQPDKAQEYLKDWLTAEFLGSLVFFYHKTPTELSRFKLRADFLRKNTQAKDIVYVKDEHEDSLGFFGLANYRSKYGGVSSSGLEAVLVEGEFDCLAHLINYYNTGITYDIVLGVGGAAASSPDLLKEECGVDKLLLLMDHPDHNGDEIAKGILRSTKLPSRVFTWPGCVDSKDPDDAIKKHGWDKWLSTITEIDTHDIKSVHRRYFDTAHKWLVRVTAKELAGIDRDDLTSIKKIVGANGTCLKDPDVQRLFATEITKYVPLSLSTVLEIIVGNDPSEEGLVSRIIQALRQEFFFIGSIEGKGSDAVIKAWHRRKKEPREWRVSKANELFGLLAIDIGPAVTWVRENVGVPSFVTTKYKANGSPAEVSLIDQNAALRKYIEFALDTISSELPTLKSLQEVKAGAHYLTANLGHGDETMWALVNGHDVYLGRYINKQLIWSILDGPSIGHYHFNISRAAWSREIKSCHDLEQGKNYSVEKTYSDLVGLINSAWGLLDGITDCKYLAAAMMVNAISSCLPRQLYTLLNGARGTGKSKLLDLVAGAEPRLRLVESTSDVQQAYTSAGFRKDMNNCALGAALDEFEDDRDDSHSNQVRAILRDIRGLTNAPECRITRGNVESADATVYTLKCQIWACAINYLREEADISRFMQIHTIKEDDKSDPHTVVLDTYSEEELTEIRRGISVGLFDKVPTFLEYVSELRSYYSQPDKMEELSRKAGVAVPSRFLDGVVITAAMVKLANNDPHKYIQEVICAKVNLLNIITESTHEKDLMGAILSSKVEYKRQGMDIRNTTIRTILSNPTDRHRLVEMDCGLNYVEVESKDRDSKTYMQKWLIVMWPDVLRNLLSKTNRYAKETPERLKRMGDSSHSAVPYNTARKKAGALKQFLGPGISSSEITIFNITDMMDEWDNRSVPENDKT